MIVNGRGGGIGFPFTPSQWQELEQQALIFKYMLSGVPVPPHLLLFTLTTRSSTSSLRHFAHPTLPQSYSSSSVGWRCFEMGRKIEPEPGRCRRTDGKKWRCSKEAFQDSKYCEKHMQRGKNRSRKPVVQQQQLPHTSSLTTTSSQTTSDKHQLHHPPPAYSKLDSTTTTHLALDSASSHHRYYGNSIHRRSSMEDDGSWQLTPLAMSSINSKKTAHHPYLDTSSRCSKLGQGQLHDIMYDVNESRRRDEHPTVYRFLEEGPPEKKDYSNSSWLNLDDKSSTTTAQLSISIPAATSHHHVFPILSNSRHQSHHSKT